jgi:metal-dependent amidase/aminoacylase/carboxypeptidase family protein
MIPVYERIKEMAEGAAIMADVDYKISLISGIYEVLVNRRGGEIMQSNLELLGPIEYTEDEIAFGKRIQQETGKEQDRNGCLNQSLTSLLQSIQEEALPMLGMLAGTLLILT